MEHKTPMMKETSPKHEMHHDAMKKHGAGHKHHSEDFMKHGAGHMYEQDKAQALCTGGMPKLKK
jgi:hypothetical protein